MLINKKNYLCLHRPGPKPKIQGLQLIRSLGFVVETSYMPLVAAKGRGFAQGRLTWAGSFTVARDGIMFARWKKQKTKVSAL